MRSRDPVVPIGIGEKVSGLFLKVGLGESWTVESTLAQDGIWLDGKLARQCETSY